MKRYFVVFQIFILSFLFISSAQSSPNYSLRIIYKADQEGAKEKYSLRCNPAHISSGSIKSKCARLLKISSPFSTVDPDRICSQVFGGPEMARIYGTWEGKKVDSLFTKSNGCEIERWNKIRFLFPRI